jgi:hypothetical protein
MNRDKALARAREEADEVAEHYHAFPDEELTDSMSEAGWLFNSSVEDGGGVCVQAVTIEEEA